MDTDNEVIIQELVDDLRSALDLRVIAGTSGTMRAIRDPEVQRPGLALAGFLDYFRPNNLQIIGQTELAYMATLGDELMLKRWEDYLGNLPAAIIVARALVLPEALLDKASELGICVLSSPLRTEDISHKIELYLERELAPSAMMHGVLMDVFGLGVLILGDSGVGKSEAALELLQRGHRLVSDDIVEIKKMRQDVLIGTSPALTKHHIEIRGLGILNIRQLYGASAIVDEMKLDMVAQLEIWKEGFEYDRLGLEQETFEILGNEVPSVLVPVQPGRNIAIIIEVGAMNQRLKNMGVHAAEEFNKRLNEMLVSGHGMTSGTGEQK